MAWRNQHYGGGYDDADWRSNRPTKPNYVPPPLRESDAAESTRPPRFQSQFGRNGGSGRGRGGFHGNRQGRSRFVDEMAEKFDELEVSEDDVPAANFNAYEDIPVEATGEDVPAAVDSFADIDLGDALVENIRRLKYARPTPIQRHAIPAAVAGRDLMACAQTGSGKTAAFCFPIICGVLKDRSAARSQARRGRNGALPLALILSPTRELSRQIHDEANKFAHGTGVKIVVAYGGSPIVQQLRNLEKGVDILVATPGRLVDMIERRRVSLSMIKYLALDEADRMLDMGFEPQIRKIVQQTDMPTPGNRQTMLFSATFPDEIQRLASDFLHNYIFLAVGRVGSSTDLIMQKVDLVQDMDKRNHLLGVLGDETLNGKQNKHSLTLVFVETKRGADALESWLHRNGFHAVAIHGDKGQMERERALNSFKCGQTPILVATDVASRGLDIPHVSHVINYDLPRDIDDYVHRIGRTGRAGNFGLATAFFSDKNAPLARALVDLMKEAKQEVPPWLTEYADTSGGSRSGGGRSRRGGGKFGGYDYRMSSQYSNGDYYDDTAQYGGGGGGGGRYSAHGYTTDYYGAPPAPEVPPGWGHGYESVVPSGWD